jgi:hypothetical protein
LIRLDLEAARRYLAEHPHDVLPVERPTLEQLLDELTAARAAQARLATPALGSRAPVTPR